MNDTTADWIFKIGSALGGVVSVLGGVVVRDLYSRMNRLEASHDMIISAISSSNKELTEKLHAQEIKFSEIMHREMSGAVTAMESMKDMARSTFHTKEDHQRMADQLKDKLNFIGNQISTMQTILALLDTDQASTARKNARLAHPI